MENHAAKPYEMDVRPQEKGAMGGGQGETLHRNERLIFRQISFDKSPALF